MKHLIELLTKQVSSQTKDHNTNIVRLESFDNPIIYKTVCLNLLHDADIHVLIPKLTKEKYQQFVDEKNTEWEQALEFLQQGSNPALSEIIDDNYMNNSFVDYNNAMTKWRNESANFNSNQTILILLMGTEMASDTGGLTDTSFAITPKKIIMELKDDYSQWFNNVLDINGIDNRETRSSINTLYRVIFSSVNIDLLKLSKFVDSLETVYFSSAQDLIAYICETLSVIWEIPSVVDLKLVPKIQSLCKGYLKSAKIITDGINFIRRSEDIPSQAYLSKLERKFAKYAEENNIDESEPFPGTDALFKSYTDFKDCIITFMNGKDLEKNRRKLLLIDYAYISKIIGTKLKNDPAHKVPVISGEPLEAYCKMAFDAMVNFYKNNKVLPNRLSFRIDRVSLSDCTKEQKKDSFKQICNFMGGIITFLNESNVDCEGQMVEFSYHSNIDPFDFANYNDVIERIECTGKWGAPCKISFCLTLSKEDDEEKYEYRWAFSPNSPWLNAFSYLSTVLFRGGDSYFLPTMVVCKNIQDFLSCESEDEFYVHLTQIREEVLYEKHRQEARRYFAGTEPLAQFDLLCNEFKDFAIGLDQHGMFNALAQIRRVVQAYTGMMTSIYSHFDEFSDVQREKLPLLVNCFSMTSNEEVIVTGEMHEVIIPAYNPVILEKIDAKHLFIRDGFTELINNFTNNQRNYFSLIENLVQLSSITQAMDTINFTNGRYLMCKSMWEYFGVYYDNNANPDLVTGNSFGGTIVTDDEDAAAMLHSSPMSNIVVRNVLDYIRTFPARVDGLNIAFVAPADMQHIVAALHSIAKRLEKQELDATFNIEIINVNSKKNSASYLRKWLDRYFSEKKCVNVNTYLKNITITNKEDTENLKELLKDYDLCFNYNILQTTGIAFEPTGNEKIDKNLIKFPMTFTPDILPATHGTSRKRKACISQFQFLASKQQTQVSNIMGNPHCVKGIYKAFKKLELSEISARLIDIAHVCCKWVVCVDQAIDRHMLESDKSKIIGFTTGEGSYGELNVTVSARKDILTDIKQMLKKRITEKFANWDEHRLQVASSFCIDNLSQHMDGSRILKALNPYDYEIHSFMAYLLIIQMLGLTKNSDQYLLRSLISLDSYRHWFKEDDDLNPDNKRPDFMLIEILNTPENLLPQEKLHIDIKIIECKMGYKSEGHINKAKTQLEKGIKTMSANWNPENTGIMHRYWLNQLYRAVIFTKLQLNNTSTEYRIIRDKIYGILSGSYEICWTGDIFAFWLDSYSDISEEWDIESDELAQLPNIDLGKLMCHSCGQMYIQKMLLPPDERAANFEYNEIDYGVQDDIDDNEASKGTNTTNIMQPLGETIPKMSDVLTPFIKHLNDNIDHTRQADLIWYETYFSISQEDRTLIFESNNHPRWETILDFTISELRRKKIIENSQVGIYHITEFGRIVADLIESKSSDESFSSFIERMRTRRENNVVMPNPDVIDSIQMHFEEVTDLSSNGTVIKAGLEGVRFLIGEDLRTKEKYYWEFGNKNLNNRHLLINGNSGCGKTYCIQALLMEAVQQGISSIIFDYTSGFASSKLDPLFKEALEEKIKQRVVKIEKIPINPFEKHNIQIDEDIFVPEEDADVADKISEIFKAVYGLGDQQKSAVYSAVLNGLKIHGANMSFTIMVEELENIGTNYAKTVISKIQAFSDFNTFAVDNTFSWSDIRDSEGMVYVFQLAGYGRDIQVLLTEFLLWDIWNFCVKNGDESKPFILVMDEAQNLSHGEKSPSAKILTEGRKFGISGWYATQFMKPQLSDDEIQRLQQAGQKLYFCPPDNGVITVARNIDITAQGSKDWADRLKKLKKGECVTCGNMIRNGKWTKYEPRMVKVTSLQERMDK